MRVNLVIVVSFDWRVQRQEGAMSAESMAKTLLLVVAAVMLVVIVVYAIFSGRGTEITIPGAVSVKLTEKSMETGGAHREIPGPAFSKPSSPQNGGYSLNVPGRGSLPFSKVDAFYIDPPVSDPQNLHQKLIVEMLANEQSERLYKESDNEGMFSAWITVSDIREGKRCFDYTTLYERWSGRVEVGFRVACPSKNGWTWEISPELRELVKDSHGR